MPEWTRRLARLRVPLGFVAGLVAFWLARPDCDSLAAGAAVAAAGEVVRIWAAGHLIKDREVTRSGPYRFCRHPLYVGSALMGLGLAIASRRVAVSALIAAYVLTAVGAAVLSEEASLRRKFGPAYDSYREGSSHPASRRFSWERALKNREYRAVIGLLAVVAALALKADCARFDALLKRGL